MIQNSHHRLSARFIRMVTLPLGAPAGTPKQRSTHTATTRTAGIFMSGDGKRMIDKEYRGARLFRRLGYLTQEEAEQQLEREIERIEVELHRKAHARPLFRHCAARYVGESKKKRSAGTIKVDLGGSRARSRPQRIRHSARGLQG